jgi:hypothetical protein
MKHHAVSVFTEGSCLNTGMVWYFDILPFWKCGEATTDGPISIGVLRTQPD